MTSPSGGNASAFFRFAGGKQKSRPTSGRDKQCLAVPPVFRPRATGSRAPLTRAYGDGYDPREAVRTTVTRGDSPFLLRREMQTHPAKSVFQPNERSLFARRSVRADFINAFFNLNYITPK